MKRLPSLVITHEDCQKILPLLSYARAEVAEQLEQELGRATLVAADQLPADIVSMYSKVTFLDMESGKEQQLILTFPLDANIDQGRVSILAPVGAALIGMRVGQEIEWPLPGGKSKLIKVLSVAPPDQVS